MSKSRVADARRVTHQALQGVWRPSKNAEKYGWVWVWVGVGVGVGVWVWVGVGVGGGRCGGGWGVGGGWNEEEEQRVVRGGAVGVGAPLGIPRHSTQQRGRRIQRYPLRAPGTSSSLAGFSTSFSGLQGPERPRPPRCFFTRATCCLYHPLASVLLGGSEAWFMTH